MTIYPYRNIADLIQIAEQSTNPVHDTVTISIEWLRTFIHAYFVCTHDGYPTNSITYEEFWQQPQEGGEA